MSFLRRLIARVMPARALRSEFQIAELASQQLLRMLVGPINLYSFNFRAIPLTPEIQEMLGFLASSTDVLAQHLGGAPSGAGSINATLRVYQELFDDKHTEVLVESTFELFDTPTEQFEIGRRLGISFASALLRQDADIPAGITVHLFSERYRSYCGNPLGLDK